MSFLTLYALAGIAWAISISVSLASWRPREEEAPKYLEAWKGFVSDNPYGVVASLVAYDILIWPVASLAVAAKLCDKISWDKALQDLYVDPALTPTEVLTS